MVVETRSQRQSYLQRPSYPQITTQSVPSSASQSVFRSSSSLASISSLGSPMSGMPQTSPSMLQQQAPFSSAPLPSPSANQPMSYFGSIAQAQPPTSYPAQQRIPQSQTGSYLGQRGGGGGMPETAPFLKDFNLVAEAAKRAQMACLARDLGDVGL
ncbi:hypothetical protein LTR36_001608 [Oleoguttula mirabilis]|uniref:Uncharacterized protein n=1 Tax=Oleoguttula mirabilis TaxID=1507867 RepID=A0AAV9JPF1_9PEZI|nr:hypothetical protein LTR36_001608 [Oleoguttula mirabilis]